MKNLLLIGDDALLLETRAIVLSKTGAAVQSATSAQFSDLPPITRFAVVVLCHSLSPAVRGAVCEQSRQRWPDVRILQILKGYQEASSVECRVDATTSALPSVLIEHAKDLLQRQSDRA